jgi:hypothetical protein
MPETIDLGNGHTAEIRTSLTGLDQKEWYIERGRLLRANGTAKAARTAPDPDNTAVMKDYPAEPAWQTEDDTFALLDWLASRLLVSCTMPGILPWTAAVRDSADLDVVNAIDEAVTAQQLRIQGIGPKREKSGADSAGTSPAAAPSPLPAPTPEPSSTASA